MPYEQLGVISTATTPTFDDFSRTLSVPCVQYPGAYANMHMYMGDNKRTFTKSASFLPFIRVAFNTRGTRRAPAKAKHFVQVARGDTQIGYSLKVTLRNREVTRRFSPAALHCALAASGDGF